MAGRSLLRRDDGASLIELALVLPVFFTLIFGFIDVCLILFGIGNANFASRAALRYATMHSLSSYVPTTQTALNNIVGAYIYSFPSNTYSVSSYYYTSNTVGSGVYITVNVAYTFNVLGKTYTAISYSTTGCGVVVQ